MALVMEYVQREMKTRYGELRLVTGINCRPESVYDDFLRTKLLYHKADGTMFYHMVQSFPKGADVDPAVAHAAALKLAEYFAGHEVLVCTHTDREHVHSHCIINSGSFDTGKKLHIAKEQLKELRQRNDEVCMQFSLPVFVPNPNRQKSKHMTIGEYHMAKRGTSKKFQLMAVIQECMRHAATKDDFIALMESEGYKITWTPKRQEITYISATGWRCCDTSLFQDRFLKERMEHEFEIRAELLYGRAHGEESSSAYEEDRAEAVRAGTGNNSGSDTTAHTAAHRDPVRDTGGDGTTGTTAENAGAVQQHTGESAADTGTEHKQQSDMAADRCSDQADGRTAEAGSASGEDGRTGWEAERETLLAAQAAPAQDHTSGSGLACSHPDPNGTGSLGHDLVVLGKELERLDEPAPLTPAPMHIDKKRWKELQKKKTALGHKPDDHEDKQTWQQTM